jgi:hypothetical protein
MVGWVGWVGGGVLCAWVVCVDCLHGMHEQLHMCSAQSTGLTDEVLAVLLKVLPKMPSLVLLDVQNNPISDASLPVDCMRSRCVHGHG